MLDEKVNSLVFQFSEFNDMPDVGKNNMGVA